MTKKKSPSKPPKSAPRTPRTSPPSPKSDELFIAATVEPKTAEVTVIRGLKRIYWEKMRSGTDPKRYAAQSVRKGAASEKELALIERDYSADVASDIEGLLTAATALMISLSTADRDAADADADLVRLTPKKAAKPKAKAGQKAKAQR